MPNRKGQHYIGAFHGLNIKLVFNGLNELSFRLDWLLDGKENPVYKHILSGKVIDAGQYGYYIIESADIVGDGVCEYKDVTAVGYESILSRNKLGDLEGTMRLYDPLNPNNEESILGFFHQQNPQWSIRTVSADLWNVFRTFDVQTTDWYNFLAQEVEEKYQCIFVFDTINMAVDCLTPQESLTPTNIFVAYDNLIDNINIEEKFTEVKTGMSCYGAGDLDIRVVNPIGGNVIYDFSYFKNTEWLSQSTIDKLTLWENKVEVARAEYQNKVTQLLETQQSLTTEQSALSLLEGDLKAKEQQMAIAMSNGDGGSYGRYVNEKNVIAAQINTKKNVIAGLEAAKNGILDLLTSANQELSFESNFTAEEHNELKSILMVDSYQNDGFLKTDNMSNEDVILESLNLYNHCQNLLHTVSAPRYYFKADLVNFIFLPEYEMFTRQMDVGAEITVEIKKGWRTKVNVLSISLDFDNPANLDIEFSNRYRLDNGEMDFTSLLAKSSYQSGSYQWEKALLGEPVKSGQWNDVKNFMNSTLDAAKNELVSASNVSVIFDGSGIHGRKPQLNPDNSVVKDIYGNTLFEPEQLWITNNMIALSDDSFNTLPKIAIGKMKLPDGSGGYGVNAEFLLGKLLAGNSLVIESQATDGNGNSQFTVDGSGVKLKGASLEVISSNNLSRIQIDPVNGFKVQAKLDGEWEDKISLDRDGNALFKGRLEAEEGKIAGWMIYKNELRSDLGDFINSENGTGKLSLLTWSPSAATFDGNIYAKNLRAGYDGGRYNGYVGSGHFASNSLDGDRMVDRSIGEGKLVKTFTDKVTETSAGVIANAEKIGANARLFAEFKEATNHSLAIIEATANAAKAQIQISADRYGNVASVVVSSDGKQSRIALNADVVTINGTVYGDNGQVGLVSKVARLEADYANIGTLVANKVKATSLSASQFSYGNIPAGWKWNYSHYHTIGEEEVFAPDPNGGSRLHKKTIKFVKSVVANGLMDGMYVIGAIAR